MNRNWEFYGSRRGGVYSKVLKTLSVFVLVLLISLTGCQNNGYPGGWPIFPPTTSGLDKLESEEVASALDVAGIIEDLEDPRDGMSVDWSIESGSSGGSSSLSRLAMPFADGQSSTAVTLVATVTFSGYSGNGLNTESGISEISRGTIRFTFEGTQETSSGEVTANLTDFKAETISTLSFVQTNGVLSNDYNVSTSKMTGTVSVTVSYSEGTTSGVISNADVNVSAGDTIINSGSSITVGNDTPIVDNTWKGGVDDSWYEENKDSFKISTPEQLAGLAKLVNGGKNFSGKTITLTSDLDLGNVDWTPIGIEDESNPVSSNYSGKETNYNLFKGTFDGGNNTISNLSIVTDKTGNSGSGLFGVIGHGAKIQNLVIENCSTESNIASFFVGAFVGLVPGWDTEPADGSYTELSNLRLEGDVRITGSASSGGIIGRNHTESRIKISDCHVDAASGSYIRGIEDGPNIMGGIIGAAYGNHGNEANVIENCSVSVDQILGYTQCLGGIAGHFQEGKIDNVSVTNTEIILIPAAETAVAYYYYDPYGIGMISGTVGGTEPVDGVSVCIPDEGHEVIVTNSPLSNFTGTSLDSGDTPYENQPYYFDGRFGTVRNTQPISHYESVSPEKVVLMEE